MKDIILTESTINGKLVETTNGRDLQLALGNSTQYSIWIKRALESAYLVENEDYVSLYKNVQREIGATRQKDYYLTIESAKAIAMMQRSIIGKQVRDYYIELEKTLSKPKTTLELLKEAVADLEAKELQLSQSNAEKARIYNEFIGSMSIDGLRDFKSTADRIGIHGFGRNTMLKCLRDKKWLTKDNKPYRAQIESKRFVVRTFRHEYDNGDIWSRDVVLVTEKGIVDILLIAQEWLKSQMDMPAIAPPPPAPTIELLDDRLTLQDYYKVGWTDKLLIEHNKAKYV